MKRLHKESFHMMKMKYLSVLAVVFVSSVASAGTEKYTYLDYDKSVQTVTIEQGRTFLHPLSGVNEIILSGFEKPIDITIDDSSELGAELPQDVAIHSLGNKEVVLEAVEISKDSSGVAEVRANLDQMKQDGSIESSGEEICPAQASRILTIAIRDLGALSYCLVKSK